MDFPKVAPTGCPAGSHAGTRLRRGRGKHSPVCRVGLSGPPPPPGTVPSPGGPPVAQRWPLSWGGGGGRGKTGGQLLIHLNDPGTNVDKMVFYL